MDIFIYEPSPNWNYCGGAKVVIADNEKHAQELIIADQKKKDETEYNNYAHPKYSVIYRDIYFAEENDPLRGVDAWILTNRLELGEGIGQPGVITDNWNYA